MFVQERTHRDFQIVTSDDQGDTWSEPRTVIEGPLVEYLDAASLSTGCALLGYGHGDSAGIDYKGKVMVRWDRAKSPFDGRLVALERRGAAGCCTEALTRGIYSLERPASKLHRGSPRPLDGDQLPGSTHLHA